MQEIGVDDTWEQQNIKESNISAKDLDAIFAQTKSYEAIFSKKAMKYKSLGLKDIIKKDADYRPYILEEYTFLSRPVMLIDGQYYIGNSKKNIEAVKIALNK